METSQMKEMLVVLEDDLSCPVCLDQLTPPVMLCKSGHNTCNKCKTGCTECPICREPFVEANNRLLNKMLNLLSKACPYTDEGCHERFSNDHQSRGCQYKTFRCLESCKWTGLFKDWCSHVSDHHHSRGFLLVNESVKFPKDSFLSFFQHGCALRVHDSYYLFQIEVADSVYNLVVDCVATKKPTEQHVFRVEFQTPNGQTLSSTLLKPSMFFENQGINDKGTCSQFLLREIDVENVSGVLITALAM